MKTKKTVACALVIFNFLFAFSACEGPAGPRGPEGPKGDTGPLIDEITVVINGGDPENGGITEAVQNAIDEAVAGGGANDGSVPEKAMTISFSGSALNLDDDLAMKALFEGIKAYYLNLDLSGIPGDTFPFYPLSASVDKTKILSLTLGSGVKEIAGSGSLNVGACDGFSGLKEIHAPGVTKIGSYAFRGCANLTSEGLALPAVVKLDSNAFYGCTGLTKANFPALESAGNYSFYQCTGLVSADLPTAKSIGNYAFSGCTSLDDVKLPSVLDIGNNAFNGCASLESVQFTAAHTVGNNAFYQCAKLRNVELPAAKSAGDWIFYGCTGLENIILPAAETVGTNAFFGCANLASISIPAAKAVGTNAFQNCSKLSKITIGKDCEIDANAQITGGFKAYYDDDNGGGPRAAGVYTYDSSVWSWEE